ncbi:glutamine--fructose-6-phosphate transaminase (isomerizing) [candidate division CSSED10-310 bacterium]|uniref:Glutamine--fructose-6-phosphate aminotransferase [isomerizing] n=1 Tax=candidate division CSSED10-310 bacterium TaxID=2855610 RepID=A0ABV6Z4C0_UNCC1
MCGIVGYIGSQNAADLIYEGLKRLEYRGYDSAGIAVLNDNKINLVRSVGKLKNLNEKLIRKPMPGVVGIGHTRWATHGEPSEKNAHPHLDCHDQIVIIHNGIVENYLELKTELINSGHTFRSETDSEVIVHLIEEAWQKRNQDSLISATGQALLRLEGAHAIIIQSVLVPDRILAVRIGNAGGIAIGKGENEMFLASDIPAILPHTRTIVFLESMEIAAIRQDGFSCYSLHGEPRSKEYFQIPWDPVSAARGHYSHFMQKEIYEQPLSLTDTLRNRLNLDHNEIVFKHFSFSMQELQKIQRIMIVACGTSYYAGLVGKYILESLSQIPVEVDYGSEFRYRNPLIGPETLVLALSQSGETVDTLAALEEAQKKKTPLAAIVNVPGSQISRICQGIIFMHAGPEIGVASTKAFTSTLVDLFLLGFYLGHQRGFLKPEMRKNLLQKLVRLPKIASDVLAKDAIYKELASQFYEASDFLFLGRGINYPIALEGAHKLKEISYIHAEGCPAGEMKHGINALIDRHLPVVAIATQEKLYQKMLSNIQQVKARDGIIIAIVSDDKGEVGQFADYCIEVPNLHPLLNPVLNIIPLQLLAYYVALKRGCDIDQPRNLAKSVTVE